MAGRGGSRPGKAMPPGIVFSVMQREIRVFWFSGNPLGSLPSSSHRAARCMINRQRGSGTQHDRPAAGGKLIDGREISGYAYEEFTYRCGRWRCGQRPGDAAGFASACRAIVTRALCRWVSIATVWRCAVRSGKAAAGLAIQRFLLPVIVRRYRHLLGFIKRKRMLVRLFRHFSETDVVNRSWLLPC